MGGSYGVLLARAGFEVTLIDTWAEHVESINAHGLRLAGVGGEHTVRLPAHTEPPSEGWADLVVIFTDANATADAAVTARYEYRCHASLPGCQLMSERASALVSR